MAEIWPVNLTPADKKLVTALAERRRSLGLTQTYAAAIREAVRLALSASDEDLKRVAVSDA